MRLDLYIKRPLWGISTLKNKFCDRTRGFFQSIKYDSGKRLNIEGGVRLDCPNIIFGQNDTISSNAKIFGRGTVIIGDNVVIGEASVICCDSKITIGNNSMIAAQCYVTDCNHGIRLNAGVMREQKLSVKTCVIEDNVWIGAGSMILAGSHIRSGTVVGANTVITNEIAENLVVYSNRHIEMEERR